MPILRFIHDNARWIIGGFLLTFFSSFGQTFFIALYAGDIRTDFDLSHGDFGLIYMIATLGSALLLPWVGKIVDYLSPAKVTLIIAPMLALGAIAMGFASHIITLTLTIFILRLFGQGMMTQNALTATGRWFTASRGRAVSLVALGHNAGEAILPILFVAIIAAIGWRSSWYVSAGILLLLAMPMIMWLVSKNREPRAAELSLQSSAVRDWTRGEVMRDPYFWLALMGMLTPAFTGTTIFFHQIYLVELRGWSLPVFASAFSVMAICKIIFNLIAGVLVDRFTAVRLLPSFLIPLALACLILAITEAQWIAFVFMALLGTAYGFSSTLMGTIWPEIYGTKHLGAIRSVVVALMVFSTAAGPGLTGWLIDLGVPYAYQILAMGAYCLLACGVMVFVSRGLLKRRQIADI